MNATHDRPFSEAQAQGAEERIVATPIGMAICDVALAGLAYEVAIERGIGTRFRMV